MVRSVWKGPFVEGSLLKKADAARASGRHDVIKIWSRRSSILPQFVGLVFGVYNGQKHVPVSDNEAKAVARMLRVSPQKLNLVAQLIRGRKASAALADLQFSRKRIAVDVKKCLESAIANAENNHDLDVDDLVVTQAFVGNGLVMKRFAARGRGRSGRVYKPFSQLTIIVRQVEAEAAAA